MKFTKYIFLALSLCLLACSQKTLNINSSIKRINYPGIVSASPFIGYEISFESLSDFKIDKIQLNNENEIKDFSLYNVNTRSSISGSNLLTKGKYILSFKTLNIKSIDKPDEVTIVTLNNNKIEIFTSKVVKKTPFTAR
jgi:hypothetical protein